MNCGVVAQPTWVEVAKVSISAAWVAIAAVLVKASDHMDTLFVSLAWVKSDSWSRLHSMTGDTYINNQHISIACQTRKAYCGCALNSIF
jgi:hypothetical protein